jgi:hypothetical protein
VVSNVQASENFPFRVLASTRSGRANLAATRTSGIGFLGVHHCNFRSRAIGPRDTCRPCSPGPVLAAERALATLPSPRYVVVPRAWVHWVNVVITAIVDAEGVLKGFAKVTRDETDRKRRRWYGSLTTSSQLCVRFEEFRTALTDFKRSPTWPWRNVRSCDCASRLAGGRGTSRGPLRRRR